MSLAESTSKLRRRPSIEKIPSPPHVQRALTLRDNGSSWKDAANRFGFPFPHSTWKANPDPDFARLGVKMPTNAIDEKARIFCN